LIVPVEAKGSEHEYLKNETSSTTDGTGKKNWFPIGKRKGKGNG
jgi:hypothetical protein